MGLFEGCLYRKLIPSEDTFARDLFQDTLPHDRLRMTPYYGLNDSYYVIPGNLLAGTAVGAGLLAAMLTAPFPPAALGLIATGAVAGALIELELGEYYLINMGIDHYSRGAARDSFAKELFAHELTHAWQGHNGAYQWEYLLDSVMNQAAHGQGAYNIPQDPTSLLTWPNYEAEQQASLVERYAHIREAPSANPVNFYYPYIRDNIRAADPNYPTNLTLSLSFWNQCAMCCALYHTRGTFLDQSLSTQPAGCCPSGYGHMGAGIGYGYALTVASPTLPSDFGWQQCIHCSALVKDPVNAMPCPSQNLIHDAQGPKHFVPMRYAAAQTLWAQCAKCGVLFRLPGGAGATNVPPRRKGVVFEWRSPFGFTQSAGICAAGGSHRTSGFGFGRFSVA